MSNRVILWSIYALAVLILGAALAAFLDSRLLTGQPYLALVLLAGLTVIVLLNAYVYHQNAKFNWTREELIRQLMRGETAERLSLVDPLTETFNRRYMEQVLSAEVRRADRNGSSLSLVMIDVDDFKAVNTRFGHKTGDVVLSEIAGLLRRNFRGSDVIVRYGGDEFLVILPETDEEQGYCAMRRLLTFVEKWNQEDKVPGYLMSLSYGIATYQKGRNLAQVMELADERMYQRKAHKPRRAAQSAHGGEPSAARSSVGQASLS